MRRSRRSGGPTTTASPIAAGAARRGLHLSVRTIWKCKACKHQFSVTSGTIFASRKLPIGDYLMAIAIFVNGAKGVTPCSSAAISTCSTRRLRPGAQAARGDERRAGRHRSTAPSRSTPGGSVATSSRRTTSRTAAICAAPRTRTASARPSSSCARATARRSRSSPSRKPTRFPRSAAISRSVAPSMPTMRRGGTCCTPATR